MNIGITWDGATKELTYSSEFVLNDTFIYQLHTLYITRGEGE